jgi:hypothetical protein
MNTEIPRVREEEKDIFTTSKLSYYSKSPFSVPIRSNCTALQRYFKLNAVSAVEMLARYQHKDRPVCREARMLQRRSKIVHIPHNLDAGPSGSDKAVLRLAAPDRDAGEIMSSPWAMEMEGISSEEPARVVRALTGAILGYGGWVLSHSAIDTGTVNMLFEFERQACVDIYSVLIATGVELSQSGHIRFTELCQCTLGHPQECGTEIASIDLEIQTRPKELVLGSRAGLAI